MNTVKKERNFIVVYNSKEEYLAKFDILNCLYYDKDNQVSDLKPRALYKNNLQDCALSRALDMYLDFMRKGREITNYFSEQRAQRFEQFISLGLVPTYIDALDTNFSLKKGFVEFCVNNYNGNCCTEIFERYNLFNTYGKAFSELESEYSDLFAKMYAPNDEETNKIILQLLHICQKEYVLQPDPDGYYYSSVSVANRIKTYISMQRAMYGKVLIKPNFLTNYNITLKLYNDYMQEHYNDVLKANNNKPYLYFENDAFIVYPLLSREQFHEEAENQHNCVERIYMERVARGETNIVVVRRKSNPDQSYITCEVSLNHDILQYLTVCNHYVKEENALAFQNLYQAHLKGQA